MLSYIFTFMIGLSVVCTVVFSKSTELSDALMTGASDAVELIISMSGMMCLWSGVMEVARQSKLTDLVAKTLSVPLRFLFPDLKSDCKAFELISMNVSANLLGLSNAATPTGLKAMKELKSYSKSDVASDDMITFVVMNTASIQLFPTTLAVMRDMHGSKAPFEIIICVWMCSAVALFMGLSVSKIMCKRGKVRGTCNARGDSSCTDVRSNKKSKCI